MRSWISIRGCVHPSARRSVGPSVRQSVRHTRVEFLRNRPNLNKIASGIWKYSCDHVERNWGDGHIITVLSLIYALPLIIAPPPLLFSRNSKKFQSSYLFPLKFWKKILNLCKILQPHCELWRKHDCTWIFHPKIQYLAMILSIIAKRGGVNKGVKSQCFISIWTTPRGVN